MRFIPFHITGLSENRVLAQWPAPPLTWAAVFEYPARLNAYLTDNFPLRSELIILSNLARYQLGYSTQPRVIVGRDGWLFYDNGGHLANGRGLTRLNESELAQRRRGLRQRLDYAVAHGFAFYVLSAPVKETIYPEKLPVWMDGTFRSSNETDQIVDAMQAVGMDKIVRVRDALLAEKPHKSVYGPYDTHWTGDGAYVAYRELMTQIARDSPVFAPLTQSNFEYAKLSVATTPRDLALMLGIASFVRHDRTSYVSFPYHPEDRITFLTDRRDFFAPQVLETEAPGDKTLLFMRDSFGTEMLPLLKRHFRRIVLTHIQEGPFRRDLVERYKPDVVILEVIESGLRFMLDPL
jgi:hypothetical protein